jgi:Skp family chaperone for outer membrane proteins
MTMKLFAIAAVALATLTATPVLAQAAGPQNPGPVIPGLCVYNNARLMAQSTAGQSVQQGMRRLSDEVVNELAPYGQSINAEIQALQQGRGTIPQDQFAQRSQAVQQRIAEAEQLEQTRTQELEYTLNQQRGAISRALDPILAAVYQERGCGILISGEAVYQANAQMDITDMVIQRLNAQLPSLSFNRMPVPVQQPAQ